MTKAPWDVQFTENEIYDVLAQVNAVNKCANFAVCIKHNQLDVAIVDAAMAQAGLQRRHSLFWYKNNQNIEGFNNYVFAVESFRMGYRGAKEGQWFQMDKNPLKRHNILACPTTSKYFKNHCGEVINESQDRVELVTTFSFRHCAPGTKVMVLGMGGGADVVGATAAGYSVVGIDKDPDQVKAVVAVVNKLFNDQNADEENKDVDHLVYPLFNGVPAKFLQSTFTWERPKEEKKPEVQKVKTAKCAVCPCLILLSDPAIVECPGEGCDQKFHPNCGVGHECGRNYCGLAKCQVWLSDYQKELDDAEAAAKPPEKEDEAGKEDLGAKNDAEQGK